MLQCPSPECSASITSALQAERFAYCDVCHHASFVCPHCASLNRSLAQYCKQCGKKISLGNAQEEWQRLLGMGQGLKPRSLAQFEIARLGANHIHTLCSYGGYLLLGTEGAGLLVSNAIRPQHKALLYQGLLQEDVLALTSGETTQGPVVFVTTRQKAYQLHFLPTYQLKPIYTTPGKLVAPVYGDTEGLILFEQEADHIGVRLLHTQTYEVMHHEALPLLPHEVHCIPLTAHRFLLLTAHSGVLYDSQQRRMLWHGDTPGQNVDMAVIPCYTQSQNQVYVGIENTIWRFALMGEHPYTFFPVGNETWTGCQFEISADGHELFVAHDRGLNVLEAATGRGKWSSTALGMRLPTGLFPPVLLGNHLLFGTIDRDGRHSVSLLSSERNHIIKIETYRELLHRPVLGMGCLLLGGRQEAHLVIQAISL